jgi:GAF domain-containing protein
MRLYEQAIRSARASGLVHDEALASELAARFYAARDFEDIAQAYLRKARDCYLRWGATLRFGNSMRRIRNCGETDSARTPMGTIGASVEQLDLATVIKVSQAVSGEIVLEKLIDTLMRTAIEQAGAERALLILVRGGAQGIAAEATTNGETV